MSSYIPVSNCGTTLQSGPNIEILNHQFVNEAGDTLRGTINMNGHQISNIADPKQPDDVVNVQYVTNEIIIVNKKINGLNKSVVDIHDVTEGLGKLVANTKLEIQKSVNEQKVTTTSLANQFTEQKDNVKSLANQFTEQKDNVKSLANQLNEQKDTTKSLANQFNGLKKDWEIINMRMADYSNMLKLGGLKFWVSGYYPYGLLNSSADYKNLYDNKPLSIKGKIKLKFEEYKSIYLNGDGRIKSTFAFDKDFTFFFLAKRTSDKGRLFTSSKYNSAMGWWDVYHQLLWVAGDLKTTYQRINGDDKLHLWILTCQINGEGVKWEFYDGDKLLANVFQVTSSFPRVSTSQGTKPLFPIWGNVVIGLPENNKNESGIGYLYECICFDIVLDFINIKAIKVFLNKYYKYE